MIEFVDGDMFETPADIRVNTVNCVGVMGAGVALEFKKRYPEMFQAYQKACAVKAIQPGKLSEWQSPATGEWVVNFPTKRHWRDGSRYEDIASGLHALRVYLDALGPVVVAMPALGCGNGGLDWVRVAKMITTQLDGCTAIIKVFRPRASRPRAPLA